MYLKMWWKMCQALPRDKRDLFGTPQTGLYFSRIREEEWTHTPESDLGCTRSGRPSTQPGRAWPAADGKSPQKEKKEEARAQL